MMAIRTLVCADDSYRSQMAEAFCRELEHDVNCTFAGSLPADRVQSDSIAVMKRPASTSPARAEGPREPTRPRG